MRETGVRGKNWSGHGTVRTQHLDLRSHIDFGLLERNIVR